MAATSVASPQAPLPRLGRKLWARRVLELQGARNPDEAKEVKQKIERARQHEECFRKCRAVRGLAVRSRALAVEGLKQMASSEAPADFLAVRERWQSAQEVSRARQEEKCTKLKKRATKAKKRMGRRSRSSSNSSTGARAAARPASRTSSPDSLASLQRSASDSENSAMEEAAGLMNAADAASMSAAGTAGLQAAAPQATAASSAVRNRSFGSAVSRDSSADSPRGLGHAPIRRMSRSSVSSDDLSSSSSTDEFHRRAAELRRLREPRRGQRHRQPAEESSAVEPLLRQLVKEPAEESECTAKFALYEGYAREVENMRETLFKFHEESRPMLPENIGKDMDGRMRHIDCAQSMGIPDESREWFVYHMMRQAERNNTKMAGMLDNFDKKLKFLAKNDQVECPICLETFGESRAQETLGCCHKVCKDCWQQWGSVTRGRPFCPLCRHEDFLGAVAARADSRDSSSDDGD